MYVRRIQHTWPLKNNNEQSNLDTRVYAFNAVIQPRNKPLFHPVLFNERVVNIHQSTPGVSSKGHQTNQIGDFYMSNKQ